MLGGGLSKSGNWGSFEWNRDSKAAMASLLKAEAGIPQQWSVNVQGLQHSSHRVQEILVCRMCMFT